MNEMYDIPYRPIMRSHSNGYSIEGFCNFTFRADDELTRLDLERVLSDDRYISHEVDDEYWRAFDTASDCTFDVVLEEDYVVLFVQETTNSKAISDFHDELGQSQTVEIERDSGMVSGKLTATERDKADQL